MCPLPDGCAETQQAFYATSSLRPSTLYLLQCSIAKLSKREKKTGNPIKSTTLFTPHLRLVERTDSELSNYDRLVAAQGLVYVGSV